MQMKLEHATIGLKAISTAVIDTDVIIHTRIANWHQNGAILPGMVTKGYTV